MQRTDIEYLTHTWNPIRMRCTPLSEGCQHCWHLLRADMLAHNPKINLEFRKAYAGTRGPILDRKELEAPLRLKKPAVIGVQFMGDLFHEAVHPDDLLDVFGVMALAAQHKFIVLTKRSKEMKAFFKNEFIWAMIEGSAQRIYHMKTREDPSEWLAVHDLPNVIGMVTTENQKAADERIPDLLDCPWVMRGVSIEPMLGPVDVSPHLGYYVRYKSDGGKGYRGGLKVETGIDAVVLGGETGPGARPLHPDCVRSVRDQCQAAGVPFFFKQWGEWVEGEVIPGGDLGGEMRRDLARFVQRDREPDGHFRRGDVIMRRIGHKKAGRLLDGRTHDELPWSSAI